MTFPDEFQIRYEMSIVPNSSGQRTPNKIYSKSVREQRQGKGVVNFDHPSALPDKAL